jgi:PqqD family protein of HPr-rel-A system
VTTATVKWCVPREQELRWRHWDDQYVVYHCQSGDTHLLNELAARTLRRLETDPVEAEELACHVAAALELEADTHLHRHIRELLSRFEELGLVDRVHAIRRSHEERSG